MLYPDYEKMEEPLLCYIYLNGGQYFKVLANSTYKPLGDFFGLSPEDQKRPRNDGYSGSGWEIRVQWTRQKLINQGYIGKSIERGIWTLTKKGVERAQKVTHKYKFQKG